MYESIIETGMLIAFSAALVLAFRAIATIGREKCAHQDYHDVMLTCACPVQYHLWVCEDKPTAVLQCPVCGYMLAASLHLDGRINTQVGYPHELGLQL